ncbi:MAG: saccharopine dehydrogenase C-terminal domain-containing protein [Ginsengibacter sp.]
MNSILIFGAGKSATYLIEYLGSVSDENGWKLLVCDGNIELAQSKIAGSNTAKAISIDVSNNEQRKSLVQKADIIISMLPPNLHFLVAQDCLDYSKHLLTASYIDDNIKSLEEKIKNKNLLFLCEMGLDPGIDHMSAMKLIHKIRKEGGVITSFKSHCGGLVAPENDDNPWHYKITWNPGNIVMAGSSGAVYLNQGQIVRLLYKEVFDKCTEVNFPGLSSLAWYPNRDSLSYIKNYGLNDVDTFIRTTLRFPSFCRGWNKIVNMGFTALDDLDVIRNCKTYADWFNIKLDSVANNDQNNILLFTGKNLYDEEFSQQLDYLELRSDKAIESEFTSSASLLQHQLETKLSIKHHEKDMIAMLHEITYNLHGENKSIISSLIVKGHDQIHTAMAKTVGLPLGIAAKLMMQNKIKLTGLHIPILPEIYEPVLFELKSHSIKFNEETLFSK